MTKDHSKELEDRANQYVEAVRDVFMRSGGRMITISVMLDEPGDDDVHFTTDLYSTLDPEDAYSIMQMLLDQRGKDYPIAPGLNKKGLVH